MERALEGAAKREDDERYRKGDCHQPPLSETAHDSNTGCEPHAGCAGQASYLCLLAVNDDPCAQKADAGEQPLDDATGCIGEPAGFQGFRIGKQDDRCGGETHQTQRAKANRLSMQVAVKADDPGGDGRDPEPQNDVPPVKQRSRLSKQTRYAFGTRPII